MPDPVGQTGQPIPQVPVIGNAEEALNPRRKTQAQIRQEALEKIAGQKNPLFKRVYYKTIQPGALATFNYLFWKHDPYPLVLCGRIYGSGLVSGVNLHYMTFKYIRYLIQQYCGKQFSYSLIKNNTYIYNSFRTYKRNGIRMAKLMDCAFLMTLLGTVRSFSPTEIEAIRKEIQRQLRARMNPTAEEAAEEYSSHIIPNPQHPKYSEIAGYQPLERYGEPHWPNAQPPLNYPKPTIGDARRNPDNLINP